MDIPPRHYPLGRPLFFAYPNIPSLMYDERVRGLPPRVWRRRRHVGAARLRYRRGGGRQATDAASDLLQRLTTTTTAPLFRASRCVRCRRCSRCPPGTCMSLSWTRRGIGASLCWSMITRRCGAPSSHCSRKRPRRRRHCCRMHVASRRQNISRRHCTQILQRQLHTIWAARRNG